MKYEILSWNTFTLISKFSQRKDIFWKRKIKSINFDKKYLPLIKQKSENNQKVWNVSERIHGWKIFSELLLTDKFRHYLWINATSYIDLAHWLLIYILCYLNLVSLIIIQCYIGYFITQWFLQFTTAHALHFYK